MCWLSIPNFPQLSQFHLLVLEYLELYSQLFIAFGNRQGLGVFINLRRSTTDVKQGWISMRQSPSTAGLTLDIGGCLFCALMSQFSRGGYIHLTCRTIRMSVLSCKYHGRSYQSFLGPQQAMSKRWLRIEREFNLGFRNRQAS